MMHRELRLRQGQVKIKFLYTWSLALMPECRTDQRFLRQILKLDRRKDRNSSGPPVCNDGFLFQNQQFEHVERSVLPPYGVSTQYILSILKQEALAYCRGDGRLDCELIVTTVLECELPKEQQYARTRYLCHPCVTCLRTTCTKTLLQYSNEL